MSKSESTRRCTEDCLRGLLKQADDFARREPVKAAVAALAVALAIQLTPRRYVAGVFQTVIAPLVEPTLLALGVIKVLEVIADTQKATQGE